MERPTPAHTASKVFVAVGLALLLFAPFSVLKAGAVVPDAHAAAAYAYGALVDVTLLADNIPVNIGPLVQVEQVLPPGTTPVEDSLLSIGPIPSDGSLVEHAGVVESAAATDDDPSAIAKAEVASVKLLKSGSSALITADLIKAQANAGCTGAPNDAGTTFVNLKINGNPIDPTPAPNTIIDLEIAKVILNEQHPAYNGRGFVVNALHLVSTSTGDALFRGDVIISHAVATVNCLGGPGTTGSSNTVGLSKVATPTSVFPGGTVTYTASITNTSGQACLVTNFIEHLAAPLNLVSTTGAFGNAIQGSSVRPTGGIDLELGNGASIGSGQTKQQTFVVKVADDAKPGVYFNDLEIYCANLGNFVMGLGAPIAVVQGSATSLPSPDESVGGPGPSPEETTSSTESPATRVLGRHLARTGTDMFALARLGIMANLGGTSIGIGVLFRRRGRPRR